MINETNPALIFKVPMIAFRLNNEFIRDARREIAKHIAEETQKPVFILLDPGTDLPDHYLDNLNIKAIIKTDLNNPDKSQDELSELIIDYRKKNNLKNPEPEVYLREIFKELNRNLVELDGILKTNFLPGGRS